MAINENVMEIIQILNQSGFGSLAGELMTEISLGREIASQEPDGDDDRVTIPETEQLEEAIRILRLRLIEPARALASAEQIASNFTDGEESVRIQFVDPSGNPVGGKKSEEAHDDSSILEQFDEILMSIMKLQPGKLS
ncbi:hypothetical protein [Komagataeibacter europaeus]|uniref:hypothetical protein n=1 Tax=Komagataeibacter europaeus TaxID=33995 RepID=UPI0012F7190E|nr:hypothetical protein [Komagataeibacter europaeus]GBQ40350.1 hypothetical protein AA18890_0769 [Komagataeibacter europaeus LMG 18890]